MVVLLVVIILQTINHQFKTQLQKLQLLQLKTQHKIQLLKNQYKTQLKTQLLKHQFKIHQPKITITITMVLVIGVGILMLVILVILVILMATITGGETITGGIIGLIQHHPIMLLKIQLQLQPIIICGVTGATGVTLVVVGISSVVSKREKKNQQKLTKTNVYH
jgi:hypothetical protein